MDERDFRIILHLRKDPFASFENLGRGIGLSGKATKTRIEAMEETGILTSLKAMPAAQVFHRSPRLFFYKHPLSSSEILNEATEIDPVVFITLDVDERVVVLLYNLASTTGAPKDLLSLLGPVESEVTPLYPYPRKELSKQLSITELKVLRMLVASLRVPIKEISETTGISQKVAKKIRRQLVENGLLQVQPIFQSAKSSRILIYELHVYSNDNEVLQRAKETLPNSIFLNQWDHSAVVFSCWADSIAEVFETERRLKGEPGITKVVVKFHSRAILASARLITWIEGEINRLEKKPNLP